MNRKVRNVSTPIEKIRFLFRSGAQFRYGLHDGGEWKILTEIRTICDIPLDTPDFPVYY